jgi:ferredoxin--NADP+ reductase
MENNHQHLVAVIGAGAAGMFAAQELANNGNHAVIFNRDIKPGGLVEYGIYPNKLKIKKGIRKQFDQVLENENIDYFGNILIGNEGDLTLDQLREIGFDAILVAAGAQGTKWQGLPGEEYSGVLHAKDLVYHYNLLPPYSQMNFDIGKKVAIIGVGNVMMDIARYLIMDRDVEEITAIARRGPGEIKFDTQELSNIYENLDKDHFEAEVQAAEALMSSLGQNPEIPREMVRAAANKAKETDKNTVFRIKFLYSTIRILGNKDHQVCGLELGKNTLVINDGTPRPTATGEKEILDVDTVIFAIGDRVDEKLGLPVKGHEFYKGWYPRFPIKDLSYEAFDPNTGNIIEDIFVAGWSRKASTGLAGLARRDGVNAAKAMVQYLETLPSNGKKATSQEILQKLETINPKVIHKQHLIYLQMEEQSKAQALGVEDFKFNSNEEMFAHLGLA